MALVINHNMMAANAARTLNTNYNKLNTSVQRLSSGLRINSAADDAAGLAIRELMRSDISAFNQGVRNANDAISLIQVADGAMGVIDEKLIRMKELAEQAATGTYTSTQRLIIDSEYQQMASEITRIANATNFNGVHLLNGDLSCEDVNNPGEYHDGSGMTSTGPMKIHFGPSNNSAEDYYYITIGNCTASALGVGNNSAVYWRTLFADSTDPTIQALMNGVDDSKIDPDDRDILKKIDFSDFHYGNNVDPTNTDPTSPSYWKNHAGVQAFEGFWDSTGATAQDGDKLSLADQDFIKSLAKEPDKLVFKTGDKTWAADANIKAIRDALNNMNKETTDDLITKEDKDILELMWTDTTYTGVTSMTLYGTAKTTFDNSSTGAKGDWKDKYGNAAHLGVTRFKGLLTGNIDIHDITNGTEDQAYLTGIAQKISGDNTLTLDFTTNAWKNDTSLQRGLEAITNAEATTKKPPLLNTADWEQVKNLTYQDSLYGNHEPTFVGPDPYDENNWKTHAGALRIHELANDDSIKITGADKLFLEAVATAANGGAVGITGEQFADGSWKSQKGIDKVVDALNRAFQGANTDPKIGDSQLTAEQKQYILSLDPRASFDTESTWGFSVSTQEMAQHAMDALNEAITSKDNIRAHIGALQNRLENTITNLQTQAENLQAAESRISDVDVATEMTEFIRNQILTQTGVAMLAQANALPQMAQQLLQ